MIFLKSRFFAKYRFTSLLHSILSQPADVYRRSVVFCLHMLQLVLSINRLWWPCWCCCHAHRCKFCFWEKKFKYWTAAKYKKIHHFWLENMLSIKIFAHFFVVLILSGWFWNFEPLYLGEYLLFSVDFNWIGKRKFYDLKTGNY